MVCDRLKEVEERILRACERSRRKREEVLLLGASKGVHVERLREFFSCGLKTYGENRVQEFLRKQEELKELPIDWHFIGRLQSNKVKYVIDKVSLIHSLDRESLLEELRKRAGAMGKVQEVLIEVNVGGEETKGGVEPENLKTFFESCLKAKELKVLGLMCIPPYREDPQKVRGYFALLRRLRDQLEADFRVSLPHLSMGMSHDFEVAIEEGSTIVRIGALLFGARG